MAVLAITPSPVAEAGADTPRARLLDAIVDTLDVHAVRWAFQGPADAPDRWVAAAGTADLDLWVAADDAPLVAALLGDLGGARVVAADDPRRLRHESWWFDAAGPAIVDVTVGDLRVGPLRLCPEADVRTERVDGRPRLRGTAAALDLLVRPLLRGRIPEPDRVSAARGAWLRAGLVERIVAEGDLELALGRRLAADVVAVLTGAQVPGDLATRARRRLARRTIAPRSLRTTWTQRGTILPTRRPGPVGLRTAGTLVVLCGTDGSGKSTVAAELTDALTTRGYRVRDAYFGMARGNLPGVALARRLLGVAPVPASEDSAPGPVDDGAPAGTSGDGHPRIRSAAAWYYALEYGWRYATTVVPGLIAHDVVVCDRYVYDLRWSPAPGSRAERLARVLTGRPHVLAVPDADPVLIHARKSERTVEDITAQQRGFTGLVRERVASCTNLIVDTSGATPDPTIPLVRAVVEATHRKTLRRP